MSACLPIALLGALAGCLLAPPAAAQPTPPAAGRLRYEATRRVEANQVKITSVTQNGQPVDMSAADLKLLLPETTSFVKTLVFSGDYAREEREHAGFVAGTGAKAPGPAPQPGVRVSSTEAQYLNLAERTVATVATIAEAQYLSPTKPVPAPPAGWQELPQQTRKIAGYLCHKVTVPFKKETYTLWVTTGLPFTYSPVRALTPTRGVVLALSSNQEEYIATKLTPEPVPEADVRPALQARPVSEADLQELRAKAAADLRQRTMEQYTSAPQR